MRPTHSRKEPELFGVGINFKPVPGAGKQPQLEVHSILPGSPAADNGVLPGDQLEQVNGVSVRGLPLYNVARLLLGAEGSAVTMCFTRSTDGSRWTAELRRVRLRTKPLSTSSVPRSTSSISTTEQKAATAHASAAVINPPNTSSVPGLEAEAGKARSRQHASPALTPPHLSPPAAGPAAACPDADRGSREGAGVFPDSFQSRNQSEASAYSSVRSDVSDRLAASSIALGSQVCLRV